MHKFEKENHFQLSCSRLSAKRKWIKRQVYMYYDFNEAGQTKTSTAKCSVKFNDIAEPVSVHNKDYI